MCPCTRGLGRCNNTSEGFLPKVQNSNFIMRKHHTDPRWGTSQRVNGQDSSKVMTKTAWGTVPDRRRLEKHDKCMEVWFQAGPWARNRTLVGQLIKMGIRSRDCQEYHINVNFLITGLWLWMMLAFGEAGWRAYGNSSIYYFWKLLKVWNDFKMKKQIVKNF